MVSSDRFAPNQEPRGGSRLTLGMVLVQFGDNLGLVGVGALHANGRLVDEIEDCWFVSALTFVRDNCRARIVGVE